jgi:hypothetical protein
MPSSPADRRERDESAPVHNRRATDRNRRATDRLRAPSTVSLVIPARNEARKGSRFVGGGGSLDITLFRKLGNRGLLMLANRFFDVQLTDLCYGFFGFRRAYLSHLGLTSSGFEIETELTVRAITSGLRIAEVPSIELPRRSGSSNLNSIRDGIRVLRMLLRERSGSVERTVPAIPASPARAVGTVGTAIQSVVPAAAQVPLVSEAGEATAEPVSSPIPLNRFDSA